MSDAEIKVLIFKIDTESYATDISQVERILGYEETTKLPDVPYFVDGVINYEGGILPVIKISKRFGLKENTDLTDLKIIVVKHDEVKVGIVVDQVSEVVNVKTSNIEEAPEITSGISKRYIKGLIKMNGKIIIFLNLGTILTEEEKNQLRE